MIASGDFREDVTNELLETVLLEASTYGVHWAPRLYVNDVLIEGSLSFSSAVEDICSTFDNPDKPEICHQWSSCASACADDSVCVLWGNNNECGEYHAPFLSNDDKQYDDDYISVSPGVSDSEVTEAPTVAWTQPPSGAPTSATASFPISTLSPSLPSQKSQPSLTMMPTFMTGAPVTAAFVPTEPEVMKGDNHGSAENQEVIETIQIYEASNSFAIGIGVGIGCMVIFAIIFVLICRDRQSRQRLEELTIASSMSGALPREDWSAASRTHFGAPRPTTQHFTGDNFYDDGEDLYYDHGYPSRPPPRGRSRLFPRSMTGVTRSFAGHFAVDDEDEAIEALVAHHVREKRRKQKQRQSQFPYNDDNSWVEEDVRLPSTRLSEQAMPPNKPLGVKRGGIREVIHLEDASVSSRPPKRTGSL